MGLHSIEEPSRGGEERNNYVLYVKQNKRNNYMYSYAKIVELWKKGRKRYKS